MVNTSLTRFLSYGSRALIFTAAFAGTLAPLGAHAQSVPIPFAGLLAGGGPVCSTSLSVFAVSGTGAKYGDGCPATQATLNVPVAVATDSNGNVFIADQTDMLVRVVYNGGTALAAAITASNVQNPGLIPVKGNIYTIAGGITATPTEGTKYCNQAASGTIGTDVSLDGCPASESEQGPRGLAVDADGNIFISSVSPDSQIRVIYVAGTAITKLITLANPTITSPQVGYVYNIAGGNSSSYTGDGALASKATMNTPRGIAIDANENVYFADQLNNVIRRIDSTTGFISTVAGHCVVSGSNCTATATSGDGSLATSSTVNIDSPYAVALDQNGNLFIAEGGNTSTVPGRIRVVYTAGTLPGISAPIVGDIYTYAGGNSGTTPAQLTTFQNLYGVSIDATGYVYVTDYRSGSSGSNKIWRIDPTNGNIAAIAGNSGTAVLTVGAHCNGGSTGPLTTDKYGDGCPATQAYLNTPQETLGFDAHGNFYVADRSNNVVRSFTYNNNFPNTTVGLSVTQPLAFLYAAGSLPITEIFSTQGSAAGDYGDGGGDTCALGTSLSSATTCVTYVKFAPATAGQRTGSITVSSATATIGTQALSGIGLASVLTINPPTAVMLGSSIQPLGISTDASGNVNISDGKAKQVVRTTIAGASPATLISSLGSPRQTTTDSYGDVFVADSTNNNIVELATTNTTTTFGSGLSAPQGVTADLLGNLYVADTGNNRLVYVSPATGNQRAVALSGYTLSAPTYLAMDASGDLYIIDTNNTRVLELPFGGQPQLITLPNGAQPTAMAFDPGGDAYFADKASGSILFLPVGSTTATSLITGLIIPTGVAVGANGNVFVADSSAMSAAGYNFALNASTFTTTNIGLTSLPVTLTLANAGNLSATLSTPPYVETGSAGFKSSGTPSCTSALSLATGATCTQAFVFSPTTSGPQTGKAVFTTTSNQSVTANFSATATNLILTTTAISGNTTANYGQTVTYTVTLTPSSSGSSAPTGTISFVVDGKTVSTQTVATNPYTFTTTLTVGTHSIAATYSGDPIYAGSNGSTSITVSKAATATTVSSSQTASGITLGAVVTPASTGALTFTGNVVFYIDGNSVATVPVGTGTVSTTVLVTDGTHTYYATYQGDANYATSTSTTQNLVVARTATALTLTSTPISSNGTGVLQLSSKLTPSGAGTPSGTVTFTNGSTTLGTVNLTSAVNGVVTLNTTTTSFTNYVFTASYSGDGLFQPSSFTLTMGPDFVVIAPTSALAVPQQGQAIASFTISPINGYTGTLTSACSNLPANAICRFQPTTVSMASTTSSALSVQVFAGVNPNVAGIAPSHLGIFGQMLLELIFMTPCLLVVRRKGVRRTLPWLFSMVLIAMLALVPLGCGNKTLADSTTTYTTPVGTTAVTLTLTDTNNVSRSAIFDVTVSTQ